MTGSGVSDRLSVIRSWYQKSKSVSAEMECCADCEEPLDLPHMPLCPVGMVGDLLARIDRDTRILELERRYLERIQPCPDCRDKVKAGECERCKRQAAEAEVARLRALSAEKEAEPQVSDPERIKCRHCGEEIRLIEGAWLDSETYSTCAEGHPHEPPAAMTLAPEQWHEVYDWCRDIQKLSQKISERVDSFANAMPDEPAKETR